jgi:hypothetical protein
MTRKVRRGRSDARSSSLDCRVFYLVVLAFIPVHIVANLGFGPKNGERLITAIIARKYQQRLQR